MVRRTLPLIAVLLATTSAFAQVPAPQPPAAPPPAPPAPVTSETAPATAPAPRDDGFAENRAADVIDARIAQVKAELRLSPEQDQHWAGFQTAVRNYGVADARRRFLWAERLGDGRGRDDGRRGDMRRAEPPDDIVLMRAEAEDMAARATDMRGVVDAIEPLYRALDDRQRTRLMRFIGRALSTH